VVRRKPAGQYDTQAQRLDSWDRLRIVTGVGHNKDDQDFPIEVAEIETSATYAYAYGNWQPLRSKFTLIGGLSVDDFELRNSNFPNRIERLQLNPKLGIVWPISSSTTLRGALFTSVRRPFVASQTLEPTEVAGFNQFFSGLEQFYGDQEGTVSRRAAAAVDQRVSPSLSAGVEGSVRLLDVPVLIYDGDRRWRERGARAYIYKTFSDAHATTADTVNATWRQNLMRVIGAGASRARRVL
jgi:hypothetical protein